MNKVEFPDDSELTKIERFAFEQSSIESLKIPKHVTIIERNAFEHCKKLKKIEFADDSELLSIGMHAFSYSTIESIIIPPHVQIIERNAFYYCDDLSDFKFAPRTDHCFIDKGALYETKIDVSNFPQNLIDYQHAFDENIDISLDCF